MENTLNTVISALNVQKQNKFATAIVARITDFNDFKRINFRATVKSNVLIPHRSNISNLVVILSEGNVIYANIRNTAFA